MYPSTGHTRRSLLYAGSRRNQKFVKLTPIQLSALRNGALRVNWWRNEGTLFGQVWGAGRLVGLGCETNKKKHLDRHENQRAYEGARIHVAFSTPHGAMATVCSGNEKGGGGGWGSRNKRRHWSLRLYNFSYSLAILQPAKVLTANLLASFPLLGPFKSHPKPRSPVFHTRSVAFMPCYVF